MHLVNAFNGEDGAGNLFDMELAWATLKQNVGGFAQDADTRPEDENADRQAQHWINPVRPGHANKKGADDDGDVRERIAKVVNEDAAEIQVFMTANESERDSTIDGEGGDGRPDHPAFHDGDGRAQTVDGFPGQPECQEDEANGIRERCECAGAMIAVSFVGVGGPLRPAHGQIGDAESRNVGKVVNGIVEQGDAVAEQASYDFGCNQAEGGDHGPAKDGWAQWGMAGMAVTVAVTMAMTEMAVRGFRGSALGANVLGAVVAGAIVRMDMRSHPAHCTQPGGSAQPRGELIRQF